MADWNKIGKRIIYGTAISIFGVLATVGVVKGCNCIRSSNDVDQRGIIVVRKDSDYREPVNREFVEQISSSGEGKGVKESNKKEFFYETEINGHVLRYEEHEKGFFDREPYNVLRVKVNGDAYDLYDLENSISIFSSYDFRKDKLEEVVAKGERHGTLYRFSSGEDSDYSKSVKKAFEEWDRFYSNARVSIYNKLKEDDKLDVHGEDNARLEQNNQQFDELYKSFDVFDSK